jgi:hypothetical protein
MDVIDEKFLHFPIWKMGAAGTPPSH